MKKTTMKLFATLISILIICSISIITIGAEYNDTGFINDEPTVAPNSENDESRAVVNPGGSITISGTVLWEDYSGVEHPARNLTVDIYDNGLLAASVTTNANGYYVSSISTLFGGNDIYVVIKVQGLNVSVFPAGSSSVYSYTSDTYYDLGIGASKDISHTFENTTDIGKAVSIHQALEMANRFVYDCLNENYMDNIYVYLNYYSTSYDYSSNEIYIKRNDAFDWDLIQHEYGHYVANEFGIYNYTTCSHSEGNDLTESNGKSGGIQAAWDEGWATYFAIIVQERMGADILGIDNVGDILYSDTVNRSININIEDVRIIETNTVLLEGEANEISVAGMLYDITDPTNSYDHDRIILPVDDFWGMIRDENCSSISSVVSAIEHYYGIEYALDFGYTLTYFKASPEITGPTYFSSSIVPTFTWNNQGMDLYPNDKFNLVFYDSNFNQILITGFIFAEEDSISTSYTLTESQWNTIKSYAENDYVYCTVKTTQTDAPLTGPFYSEPILISL